MKGLLLVFAGFSVSVALTAALAMASTSGTHSAAKAPAHATVAIRHQTHGCHAWSLNGHAYRASVSGALARGGTITFFDNDVMPHKLIQQSGPAVTYKGQRAMRHMGASVTVTFPKAGVYRFTTKAGEDYMSGIKTIGEDNVLRLTVRVS
ncbi:MAG: hypothetical protein WBB76_07950 [Gaiellaceae bacterium]